MTYASKEPVGLCEDERRKQLVASVNDCRQSNSGKWRN